VDEGKGNERKRKKMKDMRKKDIRVQEQGF
jgi:hypothetical protein